MQCNHLTSSCRGLWEPFGLPVHTIKSQGSDTQQISEKGETLRGYLVAFSNKVSSNFYLTLTNISVSLNNMFDRHFTNVLRVMSWFIKGKLRCRTIQFLSCLRVAAAVYSYIYLKYSFHLFQ